MKKLKNLEKLLGVQFKNKDLLHQALTHRSYLNEHPDFHLPHNERLEFLGDAVLELIITKFLYHNFDKPEGVLTTLRSSLVNTESLSKTAHTLHLNTYMYLSKGETKSSSTRAKKVILANTFEALIGALYLDRGFRSTEKFIHQHVLPQLQTIIKHRLYRDAKSHFQQIVQGKFKITPHYKVLQQTGPDHNKKFIVGVYIDKKLIAQGRGKSKQEAEVSAAQNALKKKI
ncbi:ribonuclease III [Patescibacteria group bacterium AH-259-L05]|nr:ribonuclease III [Patescibacteria group bacterium AH-259-L05]